jgi:hypothetical protein
MGDRRTLLDQVARAMEPEAWAEYDAGKGRCTNQSGWKCLDSLDHAAKALDFLEGKKLLKGVWTDVVP